MTYKHVLKKRKVFLLNTESSDRVATSVQVKHL